MTKKNHLEESRISLAVLASLYEGDAARAAMTLDLIDQGDPDAIARYIAALQSWGVQLLQVIDQLALMGECPNANATRLLDHLAKQLALSDGIYV